MVGSGSNSQVDMSTAVEASNSQVDIMSEAVSGTGNKGLNYNILKINFIINDLLL